MRGILFLILIILFFSENSLSQKHENHGAKPDADSVVKYKQTENTKKIIAYLKKSAENFDFKEIGEFLVNEKGVDFYKKQLEDASPESRLSLKLKLADQLVQAGNTEEGIILAEEIYNEIKSDWTKGAFMQEVKKLLAIANLRLGEQKNCVLNHTAASCIFPIQKEGFYSIQNPTRKAIKLYTELIEQDNTDLLSRWLLNIGYMTLGLYPDSVPKSYYIDCNTLDSEYKVDKFKDLAPSLGLDLVGLSGSTCTDDFDNDGDLDVFFSRQGVNTICRYFTNNADGTFSDKSMEAGLDGEIMGKTCIHGDFNNDGFTDIFVCRGSWQLQTDNYPPSSLLKNNGNGTFDDVTIESGLLFFHPASSATWADFDNDGRLDLFVAVETQDFNGVIKESYKCKLFHNNGDGTFTDIAKESGTDATLFVKGVVSGDYNNDGWMDIYMSCLNGSPVLLKNNGIGENGKLSFINATKEAKIDGPYHGFSCFFFDFNNDGWLDIFAPSFDIQANSDIPREYLGLPVKGTLPKLYMNMKNGTFTDVAKAMNIQRMIFTMGLNYGDIDNDGFQDIYAGTGFLDYKFLFPNLMFRNNEGKGFQDVTNSSGTGHLQKGHGIGFWDADNDGDQDIFEVMGGGYSGDIYQNVFYENPGNDNKWVTLKLEGKKSNRSAIGSKIKITVTTENGEQDIYNYVSTGGSFGASSLQLETGLGNAKAIKQIEVFWASGNKQIFKNAELNMIYKIVEGEKELIHSHPKSFSFSKKKNEMHEHHH